MILDTPHDWPDDISQSYEYMPVANTTVQVQHHFNADNSDENAEDEDDNEEDECYYDDDEEDEYDDNDDDDDDDDDADADAVDAVDADADAVDADADADADAVDADADAVADDEDDGDEYYDEPDDYLSNRPQQRWNNTQLLVLLTCNVKSFSLLSLQAFFRGRSQTAKLGPNSLHANSRCCRMRPPHNMAESHRHPL